MPPRWAPPPLLLVLALALAACGPPPRPHRVLPPTTLDAIAGAWGLEDGSNTVMEIATDTGVPHVEAWASDDKSAFEVADVSWDGRRLHLRFTYPRTRFTSTSDLELVDAQTLEGDGRGAGYHAHETWRRLPPVAPVDPARPATADKP